MMATNPSYLENNKPSEKAFEVQWDVAQDPDDPKNLPMWKKWIVLAIVSQCAFCVTFSSTVYATTYGQITKEFHCSQEVAILGLSFFVLGLAFGPMLFAPLSEFYGRRPIYITSLSASIIWLIPCAVARNVQIMIVARFLGGFSGSAFLAVSAGTVVDLFSRDQLQFPMVVYSAVQFLGPVMGPVVGGFITQFTTWRWCFYVLLIWTGLLLTLILFCVPETFPKVLLRNKAKKIRQITGDERWYASIEKMDRSITQTVIHSCYRPFRLLTFEPMCLILCLHSALLLGILYLFFGAFVIVFRNNHGFNGWEVGMTFLGIGCGMVVGILSDRLWYNNYQRLVRQAQITGGESGGAEPEFRLPPALLGSVLIPVGLFWFGWTTYPSIRWIVPIIGSAFFGGGIFLTFTGIFTFLADAYPSYAASALAANVFVRCCFAAAFPLFGDQMYHNLGYQWATTLLGFLTLAMIPFPQVSLLLLQPRSSSLCILLRSVTQFSVLYIREENTRQKPLY